MNFFLASGPFAFGQTTERVHVNLFRSCEFFFCAPDPQTSVTAAAAALCDQYEVQRAAKADAPGLLKFLPGVAHHLVVNLLVEFTKPRSSTLADLSTY